MGLLRDTGEALEAFDWLDEDALREFDLWRELQELLKRANLFLETGRADEAKATEALAPSAAEQAECRRKYGDD
jgi:hypothetical protein